MLDEVLILIVPEPSNTSHKHPEFPRRFINKIYKHCKLFTTHHKEFSDSPEALAEHHPNLGQACGLVFGVDTCFQLFIGCLKPLKKRLDLVRGALLSLMWPVNHVDIVELEGSCRWQLPSLTHLELKSIDPLVSEAGLVALLAPVNRFLGFDCCKNFFIHHHQNLGDISLVRNIEIQFIAAIGIENREVKSRYSHLLLQLRDQL